MILLGEEIAARVDVRLRASEMRDQPQPNWLALSLSVVAVVSGVTEIPIIFVCTIIMS